MNNTTEVLVVFISSEIQSFNLIYHRFRKTLNDFLVIQIMSQVFRMLWICWVSGFFFNLLLASNFLEID